MLDVAVQESRSEENLAGASAPLEAGPGESARGTVEATTAGIHSAQ